MATARKKEQKTPPTPPKQDEMIRDIDESIQQDRLKELWHKYDFIIVTLVVGIILITAIVSGWKSWTFSQNEKHTDTFLEALENPDLSKSLNEYIETSTGSHQMLALFQLAGDYRSKNQMDKATELYKQISENEDIKPLYRDLGTLLYASTSSDPVTKELLKELSQNESSPWNSHAGFEWALFLATENKYTEAVYILKEISTKEDAPTAIRQKANALITLYTLKIPEADREDIKREEGL